MEYSREIVAQTVVGAAVVGTAVVGPGVGAGVGPGVGPVVGAGVGSGTGTWVGAPASYTLALNGHDPGCPSLPRGMSQSRTSSGRRTCGFRYASVPDWTTDVPLMTVSTNTSSAVKLQLSPLLWLMLLSLASCNLTTSSHSNTPFFLFKP